MHTLSKLVVCLVMLRGRHRGLPVAIDRAVMLPAEFDKREQDDAQQETRSHYTPDRQPFTHSETVNSWHTGDMRQRPRRQSKNMSEDGVYENEDLGCTAIDQDFGPHTKGP
jgi:hypothetical protein